MASLIDNLITTLQQENEEYQELLALSMEKTEIIVKGDVDALNIMIEKEQEIVSRINVLEKKRIESTNDIAIVLNKNPKELTLEVLANLLKGQKKEFDAINEIHDKLQKTMASMVRVNDHNKVLLQESLEMIEFEMNLVNSMKQGPNNANYGGGADYTDTGYGMSGSFDAKQ